MRARRVGREVCYSLPNGDISGVLFSAEEGVAPVVLALHGWLDNAASFFPLAESLPECSVLAIDLAGHGFSSHKPAGNFYHIWDYALDVVALLEQLPNEVLLLGHSMGGAVACLVASMAPEKVRGLMLLDNAGPLAGRSQDRVAVLQQSIHKMIRPKLSRKRPYDTEEQMVMARVKGFTKLSEEPARMLVNRSSQCVDGKWFWRHDEKLKLPSPFRMDEESVQCFLQGIRCPVLAVFAEEGIYASNRAVVESRMANITKLTCEWLPGSHHFHLESASLDSVVDSLKDYMAVTI